MKKALSIAICFSILCYSTITHAKYTNDHSLASDFANTHHTSRHRFVNNLSVEGVVELESFTQNKPGDNDTDTALATIEVKIEAPINPWAQAHILLLHEDDSEQDLVLDEAFISFSFEQNTIKIAAGKQIIPFGRFESHMISDPLTLEMAETNNNAIISHFEKGEFHGSIYFFKGDIQNNSRYKSKIGTHIIYSTKKNNLHIDFGLAYLSDLSESASLLEYFEDEKSDINTQHSVPGFAVNTLITTGDWHAIFEYISTTRRYDPSDMTFDAKGAQPSSFHVEISHDFLLANRVFNFATAIQGSDQLSGLDISKKRNMVSASTALQPQVSVAIEYMHVASYHTENSTKQASSDVVSLQLAAQF